MATVAITFSGGIFEWQSPSGAKLWSFCSFFPGPLFLKRNYKSLDEAVDWLESYANKYSLYENASILTDFDEHYQHFNIPVEFPLSQLFSDKINVDLIDFYTKRYGIIVNIHKLNEINIDKRRGTFVDGDQINMTGTFQNVNVKSQLSNATQSINALSNADQATKDELLRLTAQLNELLQLLPAEKAADAEKVSKRVEGCHTECCVVIRRRTSHRIGLTPSSLKIPSALLFFAPKGSCFRFAGWQSGLVRRKNAISLSTTFTAGS